MSSNSVIEVQNLSKVYDIEGKSKDLRYAISKFFSSKNKETEKLLALNNISFNVNEGEVFGIIGPNGSGKSTLLKILSKITFPTSGKAILNGRVSSLLEVGTGFHHELSGRENIFLNGSILGMSKKEIKKKFDEIVDFSGIEKFIDTPVKHYSSGMYVRLAFSVAAHLEPEILLVDEVLSVGDMNFRRKSMGKMNEVANSGRTVILVSHNLGIIKNLCQNGIYLDRGEIQSSGIIQKVVEDYQNSYKPYQNKTLPNISKHIDVSKIDILSITNNGSKILSTGDEIMIKIKFKSLVKLRNLLVKIIVRDNNKQVLFSCNNKFYDAIFESVPDEGIITCQIPKLALNTGEYSIDLFLEQDRIEIFKVFEIMRFEVFAGGFYETAIMPYHDRIFLVDHDWKIE